MLMMKRRLECFKCLVALRNKLLCWGMITQMLELPHLLILIALELGHSKLLSVQGKPKKKLERKKRRLFIVSSIIVDAITNFTIGERD